MSTGRPSSASRTLRVADYAVLPCFSAGACSQRTLCHRLTTHGPVWQVGVGSSVLQLEMTLDGYRHVHSVDYSEVVIRHMAEQHAGIPQVTYEEADCRSVSGWWPKPCETVLKPHAGPSCTICRKPQLPAAVLAFCL